MEARKAVKITISLSKELLDFADQLAREWSTTRSGAIAGLLEREEQMRLHALMEEGYREMAEENRRLAEDAFPLASEMIIQTTRWDEPSNG